MKLDRSVMSLPTWMGAFCSLLTILVLAAFTALKIDVLLRKDDINVLVALREFFFQDDYVFNHQQGLNVAVAFVAYDSNPEPILDPSIGELVFKAYQWGPDPSNPNIVYSGRTEIPSHPCSREELGLDRDRDEARDSESKFFSIAPSNLRDVDFYHKSYRCVDTEEMRVHGNLNSKAARLISI